MQYYIKENYGSQENYNKTKKIKGDDGLRLL